MKEEAINMNIMISFKNIKDFEFMRGCLDYLKLEYKESGLVLSFKVLNFRFDSDDMRYFLGVQGSKSAIVIKTEDVNGLVFGGM